MPYSAVEAKRIANLCKIIDCEHKTAPYVVSSDYLVVRTSNVKNGQLLMEDMKYTTETGFKTWTQRAVPEYGDVLFTREAPAGETCLVPEGLKVCMGQRMVLLRPNRKLIDPIFLSFFLATERCKFDISRLSIGSTVSRINIADIKELTVAVPPLLEQKKIAHILSTWDKAIATSEKLLANSKQQKKALMHQLLTGKKRFIEFSNEWDKLHLKDCANCLDNKRIPLNSEQRRKMQGSFPYWGANGVVDFINEYIFDETIVLLAEDGGYFDEYKTRPIANISYGKCWVNNHAHILYAKDNCITEWLYYCLVHKNIMAFVNGGTRAKLNKNDMMQIMIAIPPLDEQKRIIKMLATVDREIEILKQKVVYLKLEKKALMQQLLTGKRMVQV